MWIWDKAVCVCVWERVCVCVPTALWWPVRLQYWVFSGHSSDIGAQVVFSAPLLSCPVLTNRNSWCSYKWSPSDDTTALTAPFLRCRSLTGRFILITVRLMEMFFRRITAGNIINSASLNKTERLSQTSITPAYRLHLKHRSVIMAEYRARCIRVRFSVTKLSAAIKSTPMKQNRVWKCKSGHLELQKKVHTLLRAKRSYLYKHKVIFYGKITLNSD